MITHGHNGHGKFTSSKNLPQKINQIIFSIFRTDYGHTEVAAHFGSGMYFPGWLMSRRISDGGIDPREYCISTRDFVVDDDGRLKGLNTGG